MDASETLYKFLGDGLKVAHPPHKFLLEGKMCFRPSATLLTSLEQFPGATAVDFPPLEDCQPFIAAINANDGQYVFSADNEVLFSRDTRNDTG